MGQQAGKGQSTPEKSRGTLQSEVLKGFPQHSKRDFFPPPNWGVEALILAGIEETPKSSIGQRGTDF